MFDKIDWSNIDEPDFILEKDIPCFVDKKSSRLKNLRTKD